MMLHKIEYLLSFLLFFSFLPLPAEEVLRVSSGLPPIAYLAKRIGGEKVAVHSLLPEGRSPHDYVPGPRDIRQASLSRFFLTTGMSFEKTAAKPLARKTEIVDVTQGVRRLPFTLGAGEAEENVGHHGNGHHDEHAHHHHHHHHAPDASDPHVWLSPANAGKIAENICVLFCRAVPQHTADFQKNLTSLQTELSQCQTQLSQVMAPYQGRTFYVYHPAFGYFAHAAGLKQTAIELEGREVSGAHLAHVIRQARAAQVKVIFVQPQFNPNSAKALARAIGGEVAELDPLSADLPENFRKMTSALQKGFTTK